MIGSPYTTPQPSDDELVRYLTQLAAPPMEPSYQAPSFQPMPPLGRLDNLALALAGSPAPPSMGYAAPGDAFAAGLLGGLAHGFGGTRARQLGMRQQQVTQTNTQAAEQAKFLNQQRWENYRAALQRSGQAAIELGKVQASERAFQRTHQPVTLPDGTTRFAPVPAPLRKPSVADDIARRKALIDAGVVRDPNKPPPSDATDIVQLTPEGLDAAARMYATTGQLPAMGMSKQSAGVRSRIINRAAALTPDLNVAANKASYGAGAQSLSQLQKQRAAVGAYEQTALKNSQVLMNAMARIPNTNSPLLNRPLRAISRGTLGSSEMAAYDAALRTVVPEFAKLTSNPNLTGQLSDQQIKELGQVANRNYSLKQMAAAIGTLAQDATNRRQALDEAIATAQRGVAGVGAPQATPPAGFVPMRDASGKTHWVHPADVARATGQRWQKVR